jgi:hypothetical protein
MWPVRNSIGRSVEAVDRWHGGVTCEDPPGIREGAKANLYITYLRDPSGNKICAVLRIE